MASLLRNVVLLSSAALWHTTQGYIYSFPTMVGGGVYGGPDTYKSWSEAQMYASGQGPLSGGDSYVIVDYAGTLNANESDVPVTVKIHSVLLDPSSIANVGFRNGVSSTPTGYCCSSMTATDPLCVDQSVGDLAMNLSTAMPNHAVNVVTVQPGDSVPAVGKNQFFVLVAGYQSVLLVPCLASPGASIGALVPEIPIQLSLTFMNPYGYIPGSLYGVLPTFGILCVGYFLLLGVYGTKLVFQRAYALKLQILVFCVIVLGFVETATWFFVYESKNRSGIPTVCEVCPTTADFVFASVLSVAKRASSRALLLAVALGFGVVHPTLGRREVAYISGLTFAYFIFGIIETLAPRPAVGEPGSMWEFPVVVLDAVFIMWIYTGLLKLRVELTAAHQDAKLKMYARLMNVIVANIMAWCAFVFLYLSLQLLRWDFPWQAKFLVSVWWDIIYFVVLVAVSWIWSPGPEAFQYAYYSQSSGTEADAPGGMEMAVGRGSFDDENEGGMHDMAAPPGSFTIEEEADDAAVTPTVAIAPAESTGSSSTSSKAPTKAPVNEQTSEATAPTTSKVAFAAPRRKGGESEDVALSGAQQPDI